MRAFKRGLIFLIVNVIVGCAANYLLGTTPFTQKLMNEYHMYNCDIAILGQSHERTGFNPFIMNDEYNKNAFTFGEGGMTNDDIYGEIKELNKDGNLKEVYLGMDYGTWNDPVDKNFETEGFDGNSNTVWRWSMKNGVDLEYFWNMAKAQTYNDALFVYEANADTIRRIPERLRALRHPENLKNVKTQIQQPGAKILGGIYQYKGRGYLEGMKIREDSKYGMREFREERISEYKIRYFNKTASYCKENGIKLVCVTSAVPPERLAGEKHDQAHEFFQNLCDEAGVPYYDFNYAKSEYLYRTREDYVDAEGHMKGSLADRQTRLLMEVEQAEDSSIYFETNYDDVVAGLKSIEEAAA